MGKPLLLPCPFCGCEVGLVTGSEYHTVRGDHSSSCPFLDDEPVASAEEWNTRPAVDPAGVAASHADIERLQLEASYYRATLRNVLKDVRDDLARGGLPDSWRGIAETISATLGAAAPNPVSDEQTLEKLHRLDKQCRDDVARAMSMTPMGDGYPWSGLLAGIKIMAAPPTGQDVAGLVAISRKILALLQHPEASVTAVEMWTLEEALATFAGSAEQGE